MCSSCSRHGAVFISQVGQYGHSERDAVSQVAAGLNISYLISSGKAPVSLLILWGSHIVASKEEDIQREISLGKGY